MQTAQTTVGVGQASVRFPTDDDQVLQGISDFLTRTGFIQGQHFTSGVDDFVDNDRCSVDSGVGLLGVHVTSYGNSQSHTVVTVDDLLQDRVGQRGAFVVDAVRVQLQGAGAEVQLEFASQTLVAFDEGSTRQGFDVESQNVSIALTDVQSLQTNSAVQSIGLVRLTSDLHQAVLSQADQVHALADGQSGSGNGAVAQFNGTWLNDAFSNEEVFVAVVDFRDQSGRLISQDFVVDRSFEQTALFEVGVITTGVVQEVVQNQVATDGDVSAALFRSQDHSAIERFSELALLGRFLVVNHRQTDEVGQVRVVERFHRRVGLLLEVEVAHGFNGNHGTDFRSRYVAGAQSTTSVVGRLESGHCDHAHGVFLSTGQVSSVLTEVAQAFQGNGFADGQYSRFHAGEKVFVVQGGQGFHGSDLGIAHDAALGVFVLDSVGLRIQRLLAGASRFTYYAHCGSPRKMQRALRFTAKHTEFSLPSLSAFASFAYHCSFLLHGSQYNTELKGISFTYCLKAPVCAAACKPTRLYRMWAIFSERDWPSFFKASDARLNGISLTHNTSLSDM
ncbi:hypothetical protein D3C78_114250 [compost metagenome]